MKTQFDIGTVVEATVTGQGLVKGERYTVVGINARSLGIFGTVVEYTVQRGDDRFTVVNLHVTAGWIK